MPPPMFDNYGRPQGYGQIAPGRDQPQMQNPNNAPIFGGQNVPAPPSVSGPGVTSQQGNSGTPLVSAIAPNYPIDQGLQEWLMQQPNKRRRIQPQPMPGSAMGGMVPQPEAGPPPPTGADQNSPPQPPPQNPTAPPVTTAPGAATGQVAPPNPANPPPPHPDQPNYGEVAGFNIDKIRNEEKYNGQNGEHLKYTPGLRQFSAAIGALGVSPDSESIPGVVAYINEHGGHATAHGKDKIDFGDGHGPVDVLFGSGDPDPAHRRWQMLQPWLDQNSHAATGVAPQALTSAINPQQQAANQPYYISLLNQLLAGQA